MEDTKYYYYCSKCGKPIENPSSNEDGILLCKNCALELYQKIFCNNSGHKNRGNPPK